MRKILRDAFVDSIAATIYVIIVASLMYSLQNFFPNSKNTVFIPISLLLLFVFSAALMSVIVFGRPIMMYLDGKKREAVMLIAYTLIILLIITIIFFIILVGWLNLVV